jgi:hypothetical protein
MVTIILGIDKDVENYLRIEEEFLLEREMHKECIIIFLRDNAKIQVFFFFFLN